jgi:hypothetical protein
MNSRTRKLFEMLGLVVFWFLVVTVAGVAIEKWTQ